jgi:hypothetical protein
LEGRCRQESHGVISAAAYQKVAIRQKGDPVMAQPDSF